MTIYQPGGILKGMGRPFKDDSKKSAKEKLLEAAFRLIRTKGYSSTTVDGLCEFAGVHPESAHHLGVIPHETYHGRY